MISIIIEVVIPLEKTNEPTMPVNQPCVAPKVLKPVQAAELLQISVKTLIKMASNGEIPAFRAGRLWRFPTAALENWLTQHEQSFASAA